MKLALTELAQVRDDSLEEKKRKRNAEEQDPSDDEDDPDVGEERSIEMTPCILTNSKCRSRHRLWRRRYRQFNEKNRISMDTQEFPTQLCTKLYWN